MDAGGAIWHEDQLVPVMRHAQREDVWWSESISGWNRSPWTQRACDGVPKFNVFNSLFAFRVACKFFRIEMGPIAVV